MTFETAINNLKDPNASPHALSDIHSWMAGEYGFISARMAEIGMRKPIEWSKIREGKTSDKQADLEWDKTEDGQAEIKYRFYLKALEKMLSSVKLRIGILNEEARNSY